MDSAGVWQTQAHFLPIFQQICYRPPSTKWYVQRFQKMSAPNYNDSKDDYSMSSILFTCEHHRTGCPLIMFQTVKSLGYFHKNILSEHISYVHFQIY